MIRKKKILKQKILSETLPVYGEFYSGAQLSRM